MESALIGMSIGIAIIGVVCAYTTYAVLRPKHFMRVWRGEYEWSYRLKKIGSTYKWTDPSDKATITIDLDTAFAKKNPKNGALKFIADAETGALMTSAAGTREQIIEKARKLSALIQWQGNNYAWLYQNPKSVFKKLTDGRPQQIAKTVNQEAPPWWQPYVVPVGIIAIIALGAILYFVYQMYSHGAGAGASGGK